MSTYIKIALLLAFVFVGIPMMFNHVNPWVAIVVTLAFVYLFFKHFIKTK